MLKTTEIEHDDCLEVRFIGERLRPFFLSLALTGFSGLALYFLLQFLSLHGFLSGLVDIAVCIALLVFALVLLFTGSGLLTAIQRKKFFFHREGIDVHTAVLGVTLLKRWFDSSEIYDFGFGLAYHGQSLVLKFAVEHKWIFMASPATEEDANQFVSDLGARGYHYSTSKV
jgi:cytochrome b subunit of formate dehydrogenase